MTLTLTTLADSEPAPWRGPKRPDPTQDELRILGLAKLYVEADREVQAQAGKVSREDYARLARRQLEARNELLDAAHGYRRGKR